MFARRSKTRPRVQAAQGFRSKVHPAADTLGHLLALHVTPANEQDWAQVGALAEAVQEVTGKWVEHA
jgi:hypothetical protein